MVHGAGPTHLKQTAKLRKEVGVTKKDGTAVAQSSGVEESIAASRGMQKAGASGTEVADGQHESRRVEVGKDVLDNNAVNLLMAGMVSLGSMVVACWVWEVPVSSIVFA